MHENYYPIMGLSCEIYNIPNIVQVMSSEIEVAIQTNKKRQFWD